MNVILAFAAEEITTDGPPSLIPLIVLSAIAYGIYSMLRRLYRRTIRQGNSNNTNAMSAAEAYEFRRKKQVWVEGLDPETGVYFITASSENIWHIWCDSRRHFLRSQVLYMTVEPGEGPGTATCNTCGRTIQIVKLNRVTRRHPGNADIGCSGCGRLINIENIKSCGERRCDSCGTLTEIFETGDEYAERLARSTKQNQKYGLNSLSDRQEDYSSVPLMHSSLRKIQDHVTGFVLQLDALTISEVEAAFKTPEEIDGLLQSWNLIVDEATEAYKRDIEDANANLLTPEAVSDVWNTFSTRLGQGPITRR